MIVVIVNWKNCEQQVVRIVDTGSKAVEVFVPYEVHEIHPQPFRHSSKWDALTAELDSLFR